MIDKVYKTIKEYELIDKGDKILIGLSGGADSVCLTHILYTLCDTLKITLNTAHLNHNIRGAEADSDALFAQHFSETLNIPFALRSERVSEYAQKNGMSEELAGRELRYAFFNEYLKEHGFNKIATAHNRNDNAETILMNFVRGSGIKGLCGIPHRRGNIIRPILDIERSEIEEYCAKNGLSYVTDSTNNQKVYTRNKIRLELIPEIEKLLNPNFVTTVTENARLIKSDAEFIEDAAKAAYRDNVYDNRVDIKYLLSQPFSVSSRIVLEMVREAAGSISNFPSSFVYEITELIKKGKSGAFVELPGDIGAYVEYGKLYIGKSNLTGDFEYILPVNGEVYIKELCKTVKTEYVTEKSGVGFYFAADKDDIIKLRNRRDGDVFFPTGMDGRKKVKDLFIDMKLTRAERSRAPILTINDEIAGVIKKRYDKRFVFAGKGIKITFI